MLTPQQQQQRDLEAEVLALVVCSALSFISDENLSQVDSFIEVSQSYCEQLATRYQRDAVLGLRRGELHRSVRRTLSGPP